MSFLSSFDSPLFVRDRRRRYQPASADQILEAARSVVDQRMQRGTVFSDLSVAGRFFRDKLAGLEREVFAAVFLDTRHRLIDYAELFFGTIDVHVAGCITVEAAEPIGSAPCLAKHQSKHLLTR